MNYKNFFFIFGIFSCFFISCLTAQSTEHFDRFGGLKSIKFDASGFFRTQHDGKRWWLVTPEGHAYLSFGANHFHSGTWKMALNRKFWNERFGVTSKNQWGDGFHQFTKETLEKFGFNALGYHNEDHELLSRPKFVPYIAQYMPLSISYHKRPNAQKYLDVFSDSFKTQCLNAAKKQIVPIANDPLVLGIAMADVPVHTDLNSIQSKRYTGKDMPGWSRALRNLSGSSPAKSVYVNLMQETHQSIQNFNRIYQTSFGSWKDLKDTANWRPQTDQKNKQELKDNLNFAQLCLHQYYRVAKEALRTYDKHHLFLGDKLNGNLQQNEALAVFEVTTQHTDILFFQAYGKAQQQNRWHQLWSSKFDLPLLNGDGGFGSKDNLPNIPKPQYPAANNQAERAEWFVDYAKTSFTHPNYIGWHVCGVLEKWVDPKTKKGNTKPGVMDPFGKPYPEIESALTKIRSNLYQWATLQ